MFNNIGKVLKIIGQFIILLGLVLQFAMLIVLLLDFETTMLEFTTGVVCSLLVLVILFLSGVMYYAYGEFLCYMKSISNSMKYLSFGNNGEDKDEEHEKNDNEDNFIKCPHGNSDIESNTFYCPSCHKKVVK